MRNRNTRQKPTWATDCTRPAGRSWAPGGITLVELLIALALLSILLVTVYGAFFQITTHTTQLKERLTGQQELRMLMRVLSDDLGSAQWLSNYWSKGVGHDTGIVAESEYIEGGEFTKVHLHSAGYSRFNRLLPRAQDPKVHEVGYFAEFDRDTGTIQLQRREDFYLDDDLRNGGTTVTMARNLSAFFLEFLAPAGENPTGEEQWEKSWDSPNNPETARMPRAIRLTLGRVMPSGEDVRETIEFNLVEAYTVSPTAARSQEQEDKQ